MALTGGCDCSTVRTIPVSWNREISFLATPPQPCFFRELQFRRLLSHDLLQIASSVANNLGLIKGRDDVLNADKGLIFYVPALVSELPSNDIVAC